MIIKTLPFGQGVEEGGFPMVRAEVLQLFGKTLFQALNQGLEEHQALLTAREKTGHLPLICGHYVFVFFKCVLSVYDSFFHHTTLRSQQEDECKKELHDCDDVRVKCLTGSIWWRCSHSRFSCCRGSWWFSSRCERKKSSSSLSQKDRTTRCQRTGAQTLPLWLCIRRMARDLKSHMSEPQRSFLLFWWPPCRTYCCPHTTDRQKFLYLWPPRWGFVLWASLVQSKWVNFWFLGEPSFPASFPHRGRYVQRAASPERDEPPYRNKDKCYASSN